MTIYELIIYLIFYCHLSCIIIEYGEHAYFVLVLVLLLISTIEMGTTIYRLCLIITICYLIWHIFLLNVLRDACISVLHNSCIPAMCIRDFGIVAGLTWKHHPTRRFITLFFLVFPDGTDRHDHEESCSMRFWFLLETKLSN